MNAPKKMHDLYQVYVTERSTGNLIPAPMFPRAMKEACEKWAEDVKLMVAAGKEKRYTEPQVVMYLGPTENQLILEH